MLSGMLGAIGSTPVVQLERLVEPGMAEVWVKLESANPTGSYKDRMALAMIEGAERDGRLSPGQTVVEYTGGSTGSSLAYVCALNTRSRSSARTRSPARSFGPSRRSGRSSKCFAARRASPRTSSRG